MLGLKLNHVSKRGPGDRGQAEEGVEYKSNYSQTAPQIYL